MNRHWQWAWLVIAIGAVLRLQGLDWDHGLLLHPDERNIATAAARLIFPDRLIPDFHAYNGLSLYLPRLLAEVLSPWSGLKGADMVAIVKAGRLLSAFYSILALPLIWNAARQVLGPLAGLLVLIAMAVAPGLIQAAHFATTESGLILCLVALIWLSIRHGAGTLDHEELGLNQSKLLDVIDSNSLARDWSENPVSTFSHPALELMPFACFSGLVLGFGFGLKTTALVFAILPFVTVIMTTVVAGKFWAAFKAGAAALAILIVTAIVTTPQLWAAPGAYLATMRFESGVVSGSADVFWTYQFTGAGNGLFELSQLPWLAGPAVAPLGLAGLILFLWRMGRGERHAPGLVALAALTIVYAVIICGWHAKFIRYLVLTLPALALFTGYFTTLITDARLRYGLAAFIVVATCALGLAQAALYQATDARITAWQWLAPQLRDGDRIAIEPVDLGPPYSAPSPPKIETLVLPLIDPPSPQKLARMADELAAASWLVIASRRHYGVLPRLQGRFPEMCGYYDALWSQRLGYRIVAAFKRRPALPPMIDPQMQAEETFTVFDSPTVFILANAGHLPSDRITAEILAPSAHCPRQ